MKLNHLVIICSLAGICTGSTLSAAVTNQTVIYQEKCVKCHGAHAEGNPSKKGPALNKESIAYLKMEMTDMLGDAGLTGDSFSDHVKMEHNIKRFKDLGYIIDPDGMARYIYNTFNPAAKK
jgi:cytochrome c553